jgi:hypothetical protein
LALVAVHALDRRPLTDPMSFFSVGRYAPLYAAALALAGATCLAVGVGAPCSSESLLWVAAAVGAFVAASAPSRGTTVATLQDRAHLLGMASFLVGAVGALLVSAAARWISLATAVGVAVSIVLKITHSAMLGSAQRLTLALLLVGSLNAVLGRRRA